MQCSNSLLLDPGEPTLSTEAPRFLICLRVAGWNGGGGAGSPACSCLMVTKLGLSCLSSEAGDIHHSTVSSGAGGWGWGCI